MCICSTYCLQFRLEILCKVGIFLSREWVTLIIVSLQNGLSLLIAEHYRSAVEWLSCHNWSTHRPHGQPGRRFQLALHGNLLSDELTWSLVGWSWCWKSSHVVENREALLADNVTYCAYSLSHTCHKMSRKIIRIYCICILVCCLGSVIIR